MEAGSSKRAIETSAMRSRTRKRNARDNPGRSWVSWRVSISRTRLSCSTHRRISADAREWNSGWRP